MSGGEKGSGEEEPGRLDPHLDEEEFDRMIAEHQSRVMAGEETDDEDDEEDIGDGEALEASKSRHATTFSPNGPLTPGSGSAREGKADTPKATLGAGARIIPLSTASVDQDAEEDPFVKRRRELREDREAERGPFRRPPQDVLVSRRAAEIRRDMEQAGHPKPKDEAAEPESEPEQVVEPLVPNPGEFVPLDIKVGDTYKGELVTDANLKNLISRHKLEWGLARKRHRLYQECLVIRKPGQQIVLDEDGWPRVVPIEDIPTPSA